MSNVSGNGMCVEIFLCNFKDCSNRFEIRLKIYVQQTKKKKKNKYILSTFKWKQATIGSFLNVSCLVASWMLRQKEQLKLFKVSGCVNLLK